MRRLFLIATISSLVVAKPELYKEKEDFQYSRSSSDDGSKSGFYGAQRGNMGGNYERAHNMDTVAQHQMSGLVRQVEGELGDASKTRTGNVFTAANSRGVYGSGSYDLSNLEGRNFQEGLSHDNLNTQSHSSLSNANYDQSSFGTSHSSRHSSGRLQDSRYNGYRQNSGHSGLSLQTANLQSADNRNSAGEYQYGGQRTSSGYYSESGYHGHSEHDQSRSDLRSSSDYGSNAQTRLVSATPVRIVIRPGTRVAVPVAAQTYDASRSSSSTFDQNAINSEAEVLSNSDHQNNFRPSDNAKHYESSYRYSKEWEKHDAQPVGVPLAIPTVNPIPKNNELYDDRQVAHISDGHYRASGIDSDSQSINTYNSRYSSNVKSPSSSQSRHHSNYNAQQQTALSDSSSTAYTHGDYNSNLNRDLTNLVRDQNSEPKSYQSSYSYHKSWERQGDPYVITPSSNGVYDGQISQKLTAAAINQGAHSSHQYGSQHKQSHQSYSHGSTVDCDCDEDGHIRVVRSYKTDQIPEIEQYEQSQTSYDGQEELGQQSQSGWENLENLGQQTQSKWDNLEDLGQQTQSKWDNLQESQQQTQNKWDQLEVTEQETQSKWNLEDLGQQTQQAWDKNEKFQPEKVEELGEQTQKEVDSTQQQQNQWNEFEGQGQQENQQFGNTFNTFTQRQNEQSSNQLNSFNQHAQTSQMESNNKSDHSIQSTWDKINNFGSYNSQSNSNKDANNSEQKIQVNVDKIQTPHKEQNDAYTPNRVQNTWDKLNSFDAIQNVQSGNQMIQPINSQNELNFNRTQKINSDISKVTKENNNKSDSNNINSIWDKIDNLGYSQNAQTNNNQNQFSQSNLEILNQNKNSDRDVTTADVMKTVHEQSQDDTQQITKKSDSDIKVDSGSTSVTNVRYVSPGTYIFSYGRGNDANSDKGVTTADVMKTVHEQSQDDTQQITKKSDSDIKVDSGSTSVTNVRYMSPGTYVFSYGRGNDGKSDKGVTTADVMKTVSEQTQEDTQQITKKSDSDFQVNSGSTSDINVRNVSPGTYVFSYGQGNNANSNQQTQIIYGNSQDMTTFVNQMEQFMNEYKNLNSNNSSQNSLSTQSLWDKINKLNKNFTSSSINNVENVNGNIFTYGYTQSLQNWMKEHSSSDSAQTSYQYNQFGSHYVANQPGQFTTNNDNTNFNQFESHHVGSRPWAFTTSNGNTNSNQFGSHHGGYRPWQSTTNNENIHSNQFGSHYGGHHSWQSTVNNVNTVSDQSTTHYGGNRPEQSTDSSKKINTNEKPRDKQSNESELRPVDIGRGDIGAEDSSDDVTVIVEKSSNSNDKPYKTPEEIEALSLTKESNRTENNNLNQQVHTTANQNTQEQSDSSLNVLSVTQQKWLEEQRRHAQQNNRQVTSSLSAYTTSTTARSTYQQNHLINNYNSQVFNKQGKEESQSINSESQSNHYNNNKPLNFDEQTIRPVFENHQGNIQNTPSKPNKNVDNEQNLDQAPEDIEQQNMEQQFVDLEQQSENLDQQSQTSWSENLEDLGQQVQTANDNFHQQTDTQQIQNFETSFRENKKQDFYEQKYQSGKYGEVQSSQNIEDVQSESQKKADMVITPEEPSTVKPGFWKSVGSKFTSAKDKVSSWFSSS